MNRSDPQTTKFNRQTHTGPYNNCVSEMFVLEIRMKADFKQGNRRHQTSPSVLLALMSHLEYTPYWRRFYLADYEQTCDVIHKTGST